MGLSLCMQVTHLARLLASQMTSAGVGVGAKAKGIMPQSQQVIFLQCFCLCIVYIRSSYDSITNKCRVYFRLVIGLLLLRT